MVYAHKVKRVTLSGTMFSGTEVWSTGFFLGQENTDATAPTQLEADAIRNAWTTFFSSSGASISNNYVFTQCKVASIDANGNTILDEVFYSYPATTVTGQASTGTLPAQCSLVCTLFTDRPRGKASKGRMYLPGIASTITNGGKLNITAAGTIPTALQTFFNTVLGSFDVPDPVILAAKGTGLLPGLTAQNEPVIGLKTGDVIDTQRRRRNNLVEVYTSKTLTN
jgi:hypothetical protein